MAECAGPRDDDYVDRLDDCFKLSVPMFCGPTCYVAITGTVWCYEVETKP